MKRILFHGTAHAISAFTEASIGLGSDPNSALGIHTTDDPIYASEYALRSQTIDTDTQEPTVLVIEYISSEQHYINHYEEFFGDEDDETNNKAYFSELRGELIEEGIDLVDFEGGDEGIVALLCPEKINIINRLTIEQAKVLSDHLNNMNIHWDSPDDILIAINFLRRQ